MDVHEHARKAIAAARDLNDRLHEKAEAEGRALSAAEARELDAAIQTAKTYAAEAKGRDALNALTRGLPLQGGQTGTPNGGRYTYTPAGVSTGWNAGGHPMEAKSLSSFLEPRSSTPRPSARRADQVGGGVGARAAAAGARRARPVGSSLARRLRTGRRGCAALRSRWRNSTG